MKKVTIVWNIVLAAFGLYGVFVRWGPMVYEQANYQFTNPRGGSSMWPATFEMVLFLVGFVACLMALSYLFNRRLGIFARITAGGLTVLLLVAWTISAVLWMRDGMPGSLFAGMWNFDGSAFMAVAVVSLGIAAVVGCGPVTLSAQRLRAIAVKKKDAG